MARLTWMSVENSVAWPGAAGDLGASHRSVLVLRSSSASKFSSLADGFRKGVYGLRTRGSQGTEDQ